MNHTTIPAQSASSSTHGPDPLPLADNSATSEAPACKPALNHTSQGDLVALVGEWTKQRRRLADLERQHDEALAAMGRIEAAALEITPRTVEELASKAMLAAYYKHDDPQADCWGDVMAGRVLGEAVALLGGCECRGDDAGSRILSAWGRCLQADAVLNAADDPRGEAMEAVWTAMDAARVEIADATPCTLAEAAVSLRVALAGLVGLPWAWDAAAGRAEPTADQLAEHYGWRLVWQAIQAVERAAAA